MVIQLQNTQSTNLRRVVITGLGFLTPAGGTIDHYWRNITSGNSVLRKITSVDTSALQVSIGGEVDRSCFEPEERPGDYNEMDRGLFLARCATRRALRDAGLDPSPGVHREIGICLGSGVGPSQALEEAYLAFAAKGVRGLRPRTVPRAMFNSISSHIGIEFHLHGPQYTIGAACSSSNIAIARATDLIKSGRSSQILCGGVEMPICDTVLACWSAMRILSVATDPQACSLPFDKRRFGISLAEGSAMFLLEDLDSAIERGAKIYAEIIGYGENNDGMHITQPDPEMQARAITQAIERSGIVSTDVDYINAHGTGTDLNDVSETQAIKKALGAHAHQVAISSTKSVIGHGLGASGAMELLAIIGAFTHQCLPPTANLQETDPRCDLDYVPCKARQAKVDVALSNSFAFGGANCVLALRRYEQ